MPSYQPPKRATAYILYVSLAAQANVNTFQSSPTIAAGDFKVSKDGGTLTNLATLPVVTPAASKMVKISLDATEMTADNVTIVCSDASGAEWRDLVINIQTAAQQIDDLSTQVSVNTIDDFLDTEIVAIKAKTDNLPAAPAAVGDIPTAAAIADAVLDDALTEPAAVFAWGTATLRNVISWLGALSRNKILQTDTLSTLRDDADAVTLATSTVSDDGTTFTRGEWI